MHPGPAILAALVAAGLTSCHGPSGRAIEARLAGSLGRMWRGTLDLCSGELTRTQSLVARTRSFDIDPRPRLADLVDSSKHLFASVPTRAGKLPGRSTALLEDALVTGVHRLRSALRPANPFIQALRLQALLASGRAGVVRFFRSLDFNRYILPGPGDPDRTADPAHVTRRETWIERLLRRF